MKSIKYCVFICMITLFLGGCEKRNFFPDEDDPGLSRLTFYGYNIATAYINNVPYVNPYQVSIFGGANYRPKLQRIVSGSDFDTLSISWPMKKNNSKDNDYSYQDISLLMLIPKTYTPRDFVEMDGKRFSSNTNKVLIDFPSNYSDRRIGPSNIYFIKINIDTSYLSFSGLFDGNIGDSILITKGRFDFKIESDAVNF